MATCSARLIGRQPLNNGLNLEFWDHSRMVAGDRWYVDLEARITIPVRPDTLPRELKEFSDQDMEALGREITFSQHDVRNFIAASEVAAMLQEMQERSLALAPGYFGNAGFAAGFIRRKYAEWQERRKLPKPVS